MKLNQATVVAFLSSATVASSAAFSHDEFKDKIAPLLASKHLSRVLQLNDGDDLLECIADTIELESVIDVECLEGLTQEGNTFILDNSVCDPEYTDSITEACTAANGTIVSGYGDIDITADCSILGISHMLIKDTPQCMANSCDVEYSLAEIIKTGFSNLMEMDYGVECEVTVNLSGGSPTPAPKDDDSSAGKATANLSGGSPTPAPKDDDSSAGKATAMLAFAATSAVAAFFFF